MSDYSDAEIAAIKLVFPTIQTYTYVSSIGSRLGRDGLRRNDTIWMMMKQVLYLSCYKTVLMLHQISPYLINPWTTISSRP